MAANAGWGIEVGSHAIKAVRLERGDSGVVVTDFVVQPHAQVLSTPDIDQFEAIRMSVGQFVGRTNLGGASVAISAPGSAGFARFAKLPPVEPKKVPEIVKFEAVQQIPFPIEQVEWDYQTFRSDDSPEIEVGIFALTKERLNERLSVWSDLGVTPDIVQLSPVALYNAIAYDQQFTESTPGTVILDVGTTSTDLIVAERGRVWVRTFPLGGHQFTEALVSTFKLSYAKAEKLKKEAEQSKHARHVFQAMRPVFADLAQDVQRSIGYYQSMHRDADLTRLIGVGSTFKLPGLRKYLSQQLSMEVTRLESLQRAEVDGPRSGEFQDAVLGMGTAYGLALQSLGNQTINANLVPDDVVRDVMWKRKTKWFVAAASLALVTGGVFFVQPFMNQQAIASSPKPTVIDSVISDSRRLANEWREVENAWSPDKRAANAMELLKERALFEALLLDLEAILNDADSKTGEFEPSAGDKTILQFVEYETTFGLTSQEEAAIRDRLEAGQLTTDVVRRVKAMLQQRVMTVTLTIDTSAKNYERFVALTIEEWLNENFERDDRTYVLGDVTWRETGVRDEKGQAIERPDDGGINIPMGGDDREQVGDGSGGRRGRSSDRRNDDLDKLAPLDVEEASVWAPGSQIATLEVRWRVFIDGTLQVEGGPR